MQGEAPDFYEVMGIRLMPSDSHMHNTVGLVERLNATLKTMLAAYMYDAEIEAQRWEKFLPYVLLAYNSSQHSSTGYSPFFMLFGRDAHFPIHLALQPLQLNVLKLQDYSTFVQSHVQRIHDAWREARDALTASAAQDRQRHDQAADLQFSVQRGDRVVIRKAKHHGIEVPYTGPYRVVETLP